MTDEELIKALRDGCHVTEVLAFSDVLTAADRLEALAAERDELREALRLIELLGYREGEQASWQVAHMLGVANDALEGLSSEHIWRLFPNHRAALQQKEAE